MGGGGGYKREETADWLACDVFWGKNAVQVSIEYAGGALMGAHRRFRDRWRTTLEV